METTSSTTTGFRKLGRMLTWQGISTILTMVSVWLVVIQTFDLRHSVQRDTYQKAYQTVYELDRHFLEHPELKGYFYASKTLDAKTDEVTRARVESTAEWISDFFDNILYTMKAGPEEDWAAWDSYMQETFKRSPALREYLSQHRDWYSAELGEALDRFGAK